MKHFTLKKAFANGLLLFLSIIGVNSLYAQITVSATAGTTTGSYLTVSDVFTAINAGTHQGAIVISINANVTEPAAPVYLAASGQTTTLYTSVLIKPTVVATISGATNAGSAVINLDGADNVTINGSITTGGTTRDLTIQNTNLNTIFNTACIRLVGRTTLGLGTNNITIANCNITGSTTGNNGTSGSTVTTSYGIYAGSTILTTMAATSGGADYDNVTISNNLVTGAYIGVCIIGLSVNQADNLIVNGNTIGSLTNRIGFKGFTGQHLVGGNFTNNIVTAIEATSTISVAGVDVAGTATLGFQIRRNTISDIRNFNTGGYGAYGINITSGVGYVISNNVIHGVQTLNYTNSTTFNAFGIRLGGGTGHQVYYNSVNMYGAYTTGGTTNAFSAAFLVTSTAVTGIEVRNNVFANKMTSTAAVGEFMAVNFPSGYNFLNAIMERNAYMVSVSPFHFVGKIGTGAGTLNYSNLNAWKAISQVNNASNDVNSVPGSGNSNAPFTTDSDLTIPAATVTVLESTGLAIASLGLPNVDRNNVNRPAGTGTAPDLGAYEFNGSQPSDLTAPIVSAVSAAPGASCAAVSHTVTATVVEDQAMGTVVLSYSYGGVAQTPITMTLASGTTLNGTWSGVIPAAAGPNVLVTYSVKATDAAANQSSNVSGTSYTDNYLVVTGSPNQTINTGVATTISATTNNPSFGRLLISEIIQFKGGTGDGTYPAYIPTADNDFVEIVNYGDVAANAGGYTMNLYGGVTGTYTIPANTIIPSGATLVLAFSGTVADAGNLYFGMNMATTSSGGAVGYVLKNPQGSVKDVVATNSYVFAGATGVTASDWSGNIAASSGLAGVRRTVASDNNVATDWTLSSTSNLTNIGVYNSEITIVPIPQTIVWTNNFNATSSTSNPLPVAAFATAGVYTYTATFNDGTCTSTANVVITVVAPQPPVADFSGTPLTIGSGSNVTFTDLSTNIPSTWAWVITPMTGVVFTSGTTASSQNPVVTFNNAGMYTVQLTASNVAGTDDEIKLSYINVSYCASGATSTADTDIGNVTFGALNNGNPLPTLNNAAANGTYSDFTALPVQNFVVGQTYPISVTQYTDGGTFYSAYANVFIDYNNDGSFDPITEKVFGGAPASSAAPTTSGSVIIPMTAFHGNVRMRVVLTESGSASSPPCGTFSWGETEDYIINISCPSTVASPTAAAATVCSGSTTTLTATSAYTGSIVRWFTTATGGTSIATGTSYTTPVLTAGTTYYVEDSVQTCGASTRTAVVVTVNQPTTASVTVTNCGTYTWPINSTAYSTSGTYTATILNSVGCDSVITLNLTVNPLSTSSITAVACQTYTSPSGVVYTTSGTYSDTITGTSGCPIVLTIALTVNNPTASTIAPVVCDTYTAPNGTVYTSSGTYTALLTGSNGCDSVVTINLTVNHSTMTTISPVVCGTYTSPGGTVHTTSGTFTDMLTTAAGCDSIIVVNLTVNNNTTATVSPVVCNSYTSPSGTVYTASGTYTSTIPNAAGCDSVITINLTITLPSTSTITATSCGNYTAPSGAVYSATGTYTDIIPNAAGCDSVITINLTLTPALDMSVVQNGTVLVSGQGGATYQWLDCTNGNTPIAGATNQSLIVTTNGSYAVVVTKGSCPAQTSACIVVADMSLYDLNSEIGVVVSPNPTSDFVKIQYTDLNELSIEVLDAQGKVVYSQTSVSNGEKIDFSNFERGMYIIRLTSDKGMNLERIMKN